MEKEANSSSISIFTSILPIEEFSIVRFKGDREKASQVYKDTKVISPEDIADTIYWIATRPKNININKIEIMAGDQAFNPFNVVKNS